MNVSQERLDFEVVGRESSLFAADTARRGTLIGERVRGRRILVVGGGGSIGSSATRLLLQYRPSAVHVVDQSENYLAELVRDLRSGADVTGDIDLRMLPIDFGSTVTQRLIQAERPYDIVLNFAALKHVRSEKDVYSLLQMLDTNLVRQARFKEWIVNRGGSTRFFGVSTDKAANPTSLMGATKRLMEDVLFGIADDAQMTVTSARFANVAFSNGSLPQSWLRRIELGQPLAVPQNTKRYFVTQREAGEICVLAALTGEPGDIFIPRLDPEKELRFLETLANRVLHAHGYEASTFTDEEEARAALDDLRAQGRWPVLLTPLDTSGEKPYEEFVGSGEQAHEIGLSALRAIRHTHAKADRAFIARIESLLADVRVTTTKAEIVAAISSVIPNFHHVETDKTLDTRM